MSLLESQQRYAPEHGLDNVDSLNLGWTHINQSLVGGDLVKTSSAKKMEAK